MKYNIFRYGHQRWAITFSRCEIFGFFSSRSLKTKEKYISFAQLLYVQLYIYYLREVCLDTFQFLNGKMVYKLSKTNIFFFRFEGMRGEKTQIFRTLGMRKHWVFI